MTEDTQYEDGIISAVTRESSGWSITKKDGWSFWVPAGSPVEPTAGMAVRMYGKGIGYPVRGLVLDGQTVFYRTEAEDKEHRANELYGKDAADLLARWDKGDSVFSVSMGGFGPGYEQALQIATFEILRQLLKGAKADDAMPMLEYLGLSGAQWGAAQSLAHAFHTEGPRKLLERFDDDRKIQVSAHFPQAPERAA